MVCECTLIYTYKRDNIVYVNIRMYVLRVLADNGVVFRLKNIHDLLLYLAAVFSSASIRWTPSSRIVSLRLFDRFDLFYDINRSVASRSAQRKNPFSLSLRTVRFM